MKLLPNNVDIQKCTSIIGNKFDLVLIAAVRARELSKGQKSMVDAKHKSIVTALEEIQQGHVGRDLLRQVGRRHIK